MDQLFTLYLHVVEVHIVPLLDLAVILALSEAIGGPNEVQLAVKWANKGLDGDHDANYRALLAAKSVTKLAILEKCNVQLFNTQKFLIILSSNLPPDEIISKYSLEVDLKYICIEFMIGQSSYTIYDEGDIIHTICTDKTMAKKYHNILAKWRPISPYVDFNNYLMAEYIDKDICMNRINRTTIPSYRPEWVEVLKQYYQLIWNSD
jgi:hypothetical protein